MYLVYVFSNFGPLLEVQVEQVASEQSEELQGGSQSDFKVLGLRLSKNQQPWYNYNRPDILDAVNNTLE